MTAQRKKTTTAKKKTATAGAKAKPAAKATPKAKMKPKAGARASTFPDALAKLLRKRKLKVPPGLTAAPPQAYANQPASVVEQLEGLDDGALSMQAERIAGYAKRQAERARAAWDNSPLIAELRRRKLTEPPRPTRVVGASASLKKPLAQWTDKELLAAATEWSTRAR
jgi:hypothetical protein